MDANQVHNRLGTPVSSVLCGTLFHGADGVPSLRVSFT